MTPTSITSEAIRIASFMRTTTGIPNTPMVLHLGMETYLQLLRETKELRIYNDPAAYTVERLGGMNIYIVAKPHFIGVEIKEKT